MAWLEAMKLVFPLAMLLAACGAKEPRPAGKEVAAAAIARPGEAAAQAYSADEENALIAFHYGWSAEAAAVPQLVARFTRDMARARAELVAGAEEDQAFRLKEGHEFHGHMASIDYETSGQSDRLLSLRVEQGGFTGGAHGNASVGALLWDRVLQKEIAVADLFTAPQNMDRLLTQHWCDALSAAREEKRGQPAGTGLFDDCPKLEEIAIIPADRNANQRFDTLVLVASPYVAGPWAEGSYEIALNVTPELLSALKGIYRASFEPGQPQ